MPKRGPVGRKCDHCGEQFPTADLLDKYVRIAHQKSFVCQVIEAKLLADENQQTSGIISVTTLDSTYFVPTQFLEK